jgi:hypothetical protein
MKHFAVVMIRMIQTNQLVATMIQIAPIHKHNNVAVLPNGAVKTGSHIAILHAQTIARTTAMPIFVPTVYIAKVVVEVVVLTMILMIMLHRQAH